MRINGFGVTQPRYSLSKLDLRIELDSAERIGHIWHVEVPVLQSLAWRSLNNEVVKLDTNIHQHHHREPVNLGSGGLEGVFDGLNQLKEGKVSGVKPVYRIDSKA